MMITRFSTAAMVMSLLPLTATAEPPDIQTPAPVIYLADNLDEVDRLGFCIDTLGRGLSDRLQAHSCKPRGGDVQFRFDSDTGQIASAEFEKKCAALAAPAAPGVTLDLVDCTDADEQQFTLASDGQEFRPVSDESLCLAVGTESRTAGPFMARDLVLSDCETTEARLKHWTIVP